MATLAEKLLKHVEADFNPDWAEKAASLMEQAAAVLSGKRQPHSMYLSCIMALKDGDYHGGWYLFDKGDKRLSGPHEKYAEAEAELIKRLPGGRLPRIFIGTVREDWISPEESMHCGKVTGDIHFDDEGGENTFSITLDSSDQSDDVVLEQASVMRFIQNVQGFRGELVAWIGVAKSGKPNQMLVYPDSVRSDEYNWSPLYK